MIQVYSMKMKLDTYIVQCKLTNGYWGFTWATTWNTEGAIAEARKRYGKRLVSIDVVERKTGVIAFSHTA